MEVKQLFRQGPLPLVLLLIDFTMSFYTLKRLSCDSEDMIFNPGSLLLFANQQMNIYFPTNIYWLSYKLCFVMGIKDSVEKLS